MFKPAAGGGGTWYAYMVGALVFSAIIIFALTFVPQRFRKWIVSTVTFLGGLFYALEFFLPTHPMKIAGSDAEGNFLTPYVIPMADVLPAITAFAVGLGVINLFQLHGKRVVKNAPGAINSWVFFVTMFAMTSVGILAKIHPNSINKNLNNILFDGGYQALDATMFSIIAFYITSAAYRAFRVRSTEATLLLLTALIVMLGQISIGQLLTAGLPDFMHVEVIRNWILTKVNAPATRAINFGLGIGSLAVALRIWLGLERGSYFES